MSKKWLFAIVLLGALALFKTWPNMQPIWSKSGDGGGPLSEVQGVPPLPPDVNPADVAASGAPLYGNPDPHPGEHSPGERESLSKPPSAHTGSGVGQGVGTLADFQKRFQTEVDQMALPNETPGQSEMRLKAMAREMREEELEWVIDKAMDEDQKADGRALGVQLAAWSGSDRAVELLSKVAQRQLPSKDTPLYQFEILLRLQAIDGVAFAQRQRVGLEALDKLRTGLGPVILRNRAELAYRALQLGKPEALEEQDNEALSRLLGH